VVMLIALEIARSVTASATGPVTPVSDSVYQNPRVGARSRFQPSVRWRTYVQACP